MKRSTARVFGMAGCFSVLMLLAILPLAVQRSIEGKASSSLKADYLVGMGRLAGQLGLKRMSWEWDSAALFIRQGQVAVKVTGLDEPETKDLLGHVTGDVGGMSMVVWGTGRADGDLRFVVDEKREVAVRESIRRWEATRVQRGP